MTLDINVPMQIEIFIEGLPIDHSIAADLSKWNVQVKGIKGPIPFELHGTWIFQDDVIKQELVEFGGVCGGLCWAFHNNYPSILVTNLTPGTRSIKCDLNVKRIAMDDVISAIDSGSMARSLQHDISNISKKFNNSLENLYKPIKIVRIRRFPIKTSNPEENDVAQQKLVKEVEYWKAESSDLVRQLITLEVDRDRYRNRSQLLQKNLRDAEERNLKLVTHPTSGLRTVAEEVKLLQDKLAEEEYKRRLVEEENSSLKRSIEEQSQLMQEESKNQLDNVMNKIQILTEENRELKLQNECLQENIKAMEDEGDILQRKEIVDLESLVKTKDDEIKKWRSRADTLADQLQELDETCEILKESIESQNTYEDVDSDELFLNENENEVLETRSDEEVEETIQQFNVDVEALQERLRVSEESADILRMQVKEADEDVRLAKVEMERMKENQSQTEKTMEAREQSYRENVVRLNSEITTLQSKLTANINAREFEKIDE